jgi:hypothetical protein
VSDILREYRKMAATGLYFRGLSLVQHADAIGELITKHKAQTLLDYGSGAGEAYSKPHRLHMRWGVDIPRRYDPAFPKFAVKPSGTFHGVVCSDVLEHVPEAAVDGLIARLFGHAERFVFASVCCRPANKTFPDGTNLHITLHPREWWAERFERAAKGIDWVLVETP